MIVSQKKIAGSERALYFYSTVVFLKGRKQMYICPYYPRLASKGSKHKYLSVLVGRLKDLDVSTPNVVKNMNVALRTYVL